MITKTLNSSTVKVSDAGHVEAAFSIFGNIDGDGDIVTPGAIADGAEIIVSAWQHASWSGGHLPVGRGRVRTTPTAAIIDSTFFDTATGRDHVTVLRGLGDLARWSFGFNIDTFDFDVIDGKRVRLLTGLTVVEASPVLVPSNPLTRTVSVSELDDDDAAAAMARLIAAEFDRTISAELAAIRAGLEGAA